MGKDCGKCLVCQQRLDCLEKVCLLQFALSGVQMFTLTAITNGHICSHIICMKKRPFFRAEVSPEEVINEGIDCVYIILKYSYGATSSNLCPVPL